MIIEPIFYSSDEYDDGWVNVTESKRMLDRYDYLTSILHPSREAAEKRATDRRYPKCRVLYRIRVRMKR
jgi:hypothetical protein